MTLINIFGENPSEMQDILQIVVQAFLRMKQVRLSPSCMFVHQNVTDVTAGEKNMEGRRRLQEKLDEMTKLAAEEEVCDAECFSDVIAFDIQKDVKYFAQVWEGSPPMAPPNPSYSENIQELKETILSHASSSSGLTLTDFKYRLRDLWNALLNEDFVFSFKNTLEITTYRTLEEEYCKWTWSLRSEMLKIQDQLHNSINSKKLDHVTNNLLVGKMRETLQKVENGMKQYFENEKSKEILSQWKVKFELKVKELHDELVKKATINLNNVISQRDVRKKMDEQKEQYETKLFERSKELVLQLKEKGNDETQLKAAFNAMWEMWVSELTKDIVIRDVNIRQDVDDILSETGEAGLVCDCIISEKFKHITYLMNYSDYVEVTKDGLWHRTTTFIGNRGSGLTPEDQISIKDLISEITRETNELIKTRRVSEMGYNTGHIQEIAHLVKKKVTDFKPKETKFVFKKEFLVDVLLYVCNQAADEFEKLHKAFREANDPHIYLESKKTNYYNVFHKFCQGATSAAVLGGFICSSLRDPILRSAYNNTATDLAAEMKLKVPALKGNRSSMDKHFLRTLAEKGNFDDFMKYIENPREYYECFIRAEAQRYMSESVPGGDPRVVTRIRKKVEELQKLVIRAAETAREEVKADEGDATMWLKSFSDSLTAVLEYSTDHLTGTESMDVNDFDLLVEFIKTEFPPVIEEIHSGLRSMTDVNMTMFRKTPDEILIEHFCHCCWEKCPFCHATCNNTIKGHDEQHMVRFHRCPAMAGWHYKDTDILSPEFCTTKVVGEASFLSRDLDKYVPYKDYKNGGETYSKWDITPDLSELPYWKWFVCQFQGDLEKRFNKKFEGKGKIPDGWRSYTREQAIKSLDEYI